MPRQTFTYQRPVDFPLGIVAAQLLKEIEADVTISPKCVKVRELRELDTIKIVFESQLSANEQAALAAVISAHNVSQSQVMVLEDKPNTASSVRPTAIDDAATDNVVGQVWIDTSHEQIYCCVDATESAAIWKSLSHCYFNAYDAAGDISINAGYTPITWDTEVRKDCVFIHAANSSTIAVTEDISILVVVDVTIYHTTGSARTDSVARLMLDTGAGPAELAGTKTYMYHRMASQGKSSGSIHRIVNMNTGDKISVEVARNSGTGVLKTLANGCRILLQTI